MTTLQIKPSIRLRSKLRFLVWLFLLIQLAWSVPVGFLIGMEVNQYSGAFTGVLIAIVLNAIWFLPSLWLVDRYYDSMFYEIQDDEVIVRVGIWTHSVKHVPYRTVTNIAVKRDIFDRFLFNIGTLEIQTAGAPSTQTGAEESLAGLVDYEGVYNIVSEALQRYRGLPMSATQAGFDATVEEGVLVAMLEEVRGIRLLLDSQRDTTEG